VLLRALTIGTKFPLLEVAQLLTDLIFK